MTRGEVLDKYPETTKRFLKALILGIHLAKITRKKRSRRDTRPDFKAIAETVNVAYDFYQPGINSDLSIAVPGIQLMLDEDIRAGAGRQQIYSR